MLTSMDCYAAREEVVAQAIGEEMVLLDLGSGIYYSLNAVGAFLWARLGTRQTAAALVEEVIGNYEISREAATDDVCMFLDNLVDLGLLVAQ